MSTRRCRRRAHSPGITWSSRATPKVEDRWFRMLPHEIQAAMAFLADYKVLVPAGSGQAAGQRGHAAGDGYFDAAGYGRRLADAYPIPLQSRPL